MKKDVVFMTALVTERCDPDKHIETYTEFSIKSWKWWCDNNDAILFVFNQSTIDTDEMMPTWQRWYVYDILESNNIDYNRILLIDADMMVKWDCPSIWDLADGNYAGVKDDLGIGWTYHSMVGYKEFFSDVDLDWERYINNGMVVLPKPDVIGKNFCKEIIDFYEENQKELICRENNDYRGTDQTPVNYIAERTFGMTKKFLPKKFNMNHLHKTNILDNFMYIDTGYVWHFNGLPTSDRYDTMKKCWDKVKDNYV